MRKLTLLFALAASAVVALATVVFPQQLTVVRGQVVSGSLASLFDSDDNRLVVKGGPKLSPYDTPVNLEFATLCSTPNPQRLILTLETSTNASGLVQYVDMFEWQTNTWVPLDQREITKTDSTLTLDIPTCWRFAKSDTGEMRLRYWVSHFGPISQKSWTIGIDKMTWEVDPQ
ncbi:MAG: hypothetical protein JSS66_13155 [Armatimonadetes bacterium]|nr:hypothetical protein [Armatimonadota bacterium]